MKTPEEIKRGMALCKMDECFGQHEDCPYAGEPSLCVGMMCDDALAYIRQLEQLVPHWHSVRKNPPRKFECVFCYYPDKEYGSKIMVDFNQYDPGETPHFSNQALWGRCTHWMPLSEPPEEKKEDDHE